MNQSELEANTRKGAKRGKTRVIKSLLVLGLLLKAESGTSNQSQKVVITNRTTANVIFFEDNQL